MFGYGHIYGVLAVFRWVIVAKMANDVTHP
jgi:hypothetical protein